MSLFETLGTSWGVFLGITLIFMGGCAILAGQALATTWRPLWQVLPYGLLMGLGDRFLVYALFGGELLNPLGYGVDAILLIAVLTLSYRLTRVRQMVNQYPWLYQRDGVLGWREIG